MLPASEARRRLPRPSISRVRASSLEQQRIAAGHLVTLAQHVPFVGFAEPRPQGLGGALRRERLRADTDRVRLRRQRGDQGEVDARLVRPQRRREHDRHLAEPAAEELEEAERRAVDPVQVVDREQQRLPLGEPADQPVEAVEDRVGAVPAAPSAAPSSPRAGCAPRRGPARAPPARPRRRRPAPARTGCGPRPTSTRARARRRERRAPGSPRPGRAGAASSSRVLPTPGRALDDQAEAVPAARAPGPLDLPELPLASRAVDNRKRPSWSRRGSGLAGGIQVRSADPSKTLG